MKCPFCEFNESRVLDSRETDDNTTIRRRRECGNCLNRFTTYERYEETAIVVVKKDMRREKFERSKVMAGVNKACEKRPVSSAQKEALVNQVERELRHRGSAEIASTEVGDIVMRYLMRLDAVAYIRFASVYKDFQDPEKFAEELRNLQRAAPVKSLGEITTYDEQVDLPSDAVPRPRSEPDTRRRASPRRHAPSFGDSGSRPPSD